MSGAEAATPEPVVNIRALRLGDVLDCSQLGDEESLMRLLDLYETGPLKSRRARVGNGGGEI